MPIRRTTKALIFNLENNDYFKNGMYRRQFHLDGEAVDYLGVRPRCFLIRLGGFRGGSR